MKLGYIILYVPDVAATVAFYERAFGLTRRFMHDTGSYAEMETGGTALAFAEETFVAGNGIAFRQTRGAEAAPAVEVGLVSADVAKCYVAALAAGATAVVAPMQKPWGQTVSYVRDCNGFLVEICSAMMVG